MSTKALNNMKKNASSRKEITERQAPDRDFVTRKELAGSLNSIIETLRVITEALDGFSEQSSYTSMSIDTLADAFESIYSKQQKNNEEVKRLLQELRNGINK